MTTTATTAASSKPVPAGRNPVVKVVTAVPCGRLNGEPITRAYEFELVRDPEPFAPGKSRLWGRCDTSARHGLDRIAPLGIVLTDTIKEI